MPATSSIGWPPASHRSAQGGGDAASGRSFLAAAVEYLGIRWRVRRPPGTELLASRSGVTRAAFRRTSGECLRATNDCWPPPRGHSSGAISRLHVNDYCGYQRRWPRRFQKAQSEGVRRRTRLRRWPGAQLLIARPGLRGSLGATDGAGEAGAHVDVPRRRPKKGSRARRMGEFPDVDRWPGGHQAVALNLPYVHD